MNHAEAEEIYAMITSAYNVAPEQAAQRAPTWIAALEEMDGPAAATVIARYLRGDGPPVFMPSAVEFAQEVREVERVERERQRVEVRQAPGAVEYDCAVCIDQGYVAVGIHSYVWSRGKADEARLVNGSDLMAPCPCCPLGREIEFPLESRGPWGEDGFWRGRSYAVVEQGVVQVT